MSRKITRKHQASEKTPNYCGIYIFIPCGAPIAFNTSVHHTVPKSSQTKIKIIGYYK